MVTFLRRNWNKYSKLGKKRKTKLTWRRPSGRHNKMRKKRRGYPKTVEVGYKNDKKIRGSLKEKMPVIVLNIKDLENVKSKQIAVIGNVGKKKKLEIINKAKEKNIELHNVNIKKFLKENTKPKKKKEKEEKKETKVSEKETEGKK